ncbi:hypothetical protein ACFSTC_24415 [Nonomuraea ferruginea]
MVTTTSPTGLSRLRRVAASRSASSASGTSLMAGGAQHAGAAPFEQRPELLAPAGGRDADGEARQRVWRRLGRKDGVPDG